MRIAVCDDEIKYVERISYEVRTICESMGQVCDISTFESGEAILKDLENNQYDLILLDIMMEGVDGFSVAEKIHSMTGGDNLIFVTSEEKLVYEVFSFRPQGFVRKSDLHEEMKKALEKWYKWFGQRRMVSFTMGKDKEEMHLKTDEIMYIEARGHNVVFYTRNKPYDGKGSISEFNNLLELREFVKCNRSTICNLNYVLMRKDNWLKLVTGKIISVGRTYSKAVWDKYNEYIKYESREN